MTSSVVVPACVRARTTLIASSPPKKLARRTRSWLSLLSDAILLRNPSTPYIGRRPNLILLPDSSRRRLMARIVVLRMGYRIPRVWRLTTHVCLTARALGAEGVIISDIEDKEVVAKVRDVAYRFGGGVSVGKGAPRKQVRLGCRKSDGC